MATISAPKPYEKRKRTPLLIVNPETQEVVNLTESKASSSISETASEANSEVSEVKAEELALSETASVTMEVKEEDEVKEAAIEAAVVPEVNVEVAKVEVVSEPSEIHPESSSIDNDQVLEQTVENNDLEGKHFFLKHKISVFSCFNCWSSKAENKSESEKNLQGWKKRRE